jgi:hypothetical protein
LRSGIDRLCIDQGNTEEREVQIHNMLSIFQNAQRVVVYLGKQADGSESIPELFKATGYMHRLAKFVGAPEDAKPDYGPPIDTQSLSDPAARDAARAFYSRPWMRRTWIVQEVLSARKVDFICGEWELPKKLVEEAVFGFIEYPNLHPFGGIENPDMDLRNEGLLQLFKILLKSNEMGRDSTWYLIELLPLFASTKASDRRDHLYAILGLSPEAEECELKPSYKEPWQYTCRRYAEVFITQGQALRFLYISSSDSSSSIKKEGSLPSWVPDWSFGGEIRRMMRILNCLRSKSTTILELSVPRGFGLMSLGG